MVAENKVRRKEAVGSLLVLANSGSLNHAQIFGSIENKNEVANDSSYEEDEYVPHKSKLVSRTNKKKHIISCGDGDMWVEAKVICDTKTGRMRSYFYSKNTQEKVWDEPPSGAQRVVYLKDLKRAYLREKTHRWEKTGNDKDGIHKGSTHHKALNRSSGVRQITFYRHS
mmetsp:Transcript_11815/g.14732  ORF Transcript_11815/g.14732 Transcript_11815/m.14732 type:complete len:169 (-) Transcript_11815:97-603(-)|eukprot:CAMPEP_0172501594 /NCGR_PEP_ID=MMETSP1066-20121228/151284_1 /TAXON_ID=671091 /ORGANISM="Coscinodiscus wailesii, Strain CCMP2513" /LENGTH=168 /DNA_ID=CAMNT_0013276469 /DNA_START=176 /DNA_END=682 /DNA_ORIENTATION=+